MALKYVLVDNKLTPDPEDCSARTHDVRTVAFEEIVARMTGRGLALTDTEVKSVFNEFEHLLVELLQDGCAITTPFLKISPSIVGVFRNADDSFDPVRHTVRLNATLGNRIAIDPHQMTLHKEKLSLVQPKIISAKDYHTLQVNKQIKRGGTVEVKGSSLKINPSDPEQGIFIGNPGNELRVDTYIMNKPSIIIFQVPQTISGGKVFIRVKNKAHKGTVIRTGTLETPLHVID